MKTVAVWKRAWLPPSETFVRNQMDYLSHWRGIAFGVRRVESPLSREADKILFGAGLRESVALALFRLRGHSPRVTRFLEVNSVDVVHAHFGSDAVAIWRQCRKAGIPLVVTLHGHDITAGPATDGFAGWRYRRRLNAMFRYASRVIAVSQFIRGRALEHGAAPAKTVVKYIGIPLDEDAAQTHHDAGPPLWDLVFVGRLTHKKGVHDLLAAMTELKMSGLEPSLAIVGSGPLEDELRTIARDEELRVDFLGHLSPADVRMTLEHSQIFVALSRTADNGDAEGFGLVFLEAAAAGLPVISYLHGGVMEAVADGRTGLLSPEGDVSSVVAAIRALLTDPDRARAMGEAGAARASKDFNIRDRTQELEDVYDDVVANWRINQH